MVEWQYDIQIQFRKDTEAFLDRFFMLLKQVVVQGNQDTISHYCQPSEEIH